MIARRVLETEPLLPRRSQGMPRTTPPSIVGTPSLAGSRFCTIKLDLTVKSVSIVSAATDALTNALWVGLVVKSDLALPLR